MVAADNSDATTEKRKAVSRRFIVNKLNFTNFQDRTVQINFKHIKYDNSTILLARPLPCSGEILHCNWIDPTELGTILKSHSFLNLLIPDNQKLYLVTPKVLSLDESGISMQLPETGCEAFFRRAYRHPCLGIKVRFTQNSIVFDGILADFNPLSFRITLELAPGQTFWWIDANSVGTIDLLSHDHLLYSGECRIIRHDEGHSHRDYVLEPINNSNRRRFQNARRTRPWPLSSTRQERSAHPRQSSPWEMTY